MFTKDIINLALLGTTLFSASSVNAHNERKVMIELLGDNGKFMEHRPKETDVSQFL